MTEKLKLGLDVDALCVETFESEENRGAARGTVRGHVWTDVNSGCDTLNDYTCRGNGTCGVYPCHPVP